MATPTEVSVWGSEPGSTILAGLNVDSFTWQPSYAIGGRPNYNVVRVQFDGSPNLTSVVVGHQLAVSGALDAFHNGTFEIVSVNNTSKYIDVTNYAVLDGSHNESSSPATAIAKSNAALDQRPTLSKEELGWLNGEKPPAGWLNWWMRVISEWIAYFASGGAVVRRDDVEAWQGVDRTDSLGGAEIIDTDGWVAYDPAAIDQPGEGFYEPDTGSGLGLLISPHVDAIWAYICAMYAEQLPPVTATLDYSSLNSNTEATLTITVPGATAGDIVVIQEPASLETGVEVRKKWVSADDTVSITLRNDSGSPVDPASGDFTALVTKRNTTPPLTIRAMKMYLNLLGGQGSTALNADLGIAENETDFWLLASNTTYRELLLADASIKSIIQTAPLADAIMETIKPGY